jgi:hypothetical protein
LEYLEVVAGQSVIPSTGIAIQLKTFQLQVHILTSREYQQPEPRQISALRFSLLRNSVSIPFTLSEAGRHAAGAWLWNQHVCCTSLTCRASHITPIRHNIVSRVAPEFSSWPSSLTENPY